MKKIVFVMLSVLLCFSHSFLYAEEGEVEPQNNTENEVVEEEQEEVTIESLFQIQAIQQHSMSMKECCG